MLRRVATISPVQERAPPLVSRIRFQYPVGLLLCAAAPFLLRTSGVVRFMLQDSATNTAVAIVIAYTAAFFTLRRLSGFPGLQYGAPVIFSVVLPYFLVAMAFLVFRLDYSRSIFGASLAISIVWFFALAQAVSRPGRFRVAAPPGGRTLDFPSLSPIEVETLSDSEVLPHGLGAVVADLRHDYPPEWQRFLSDCSLAGVPVYHYKQLGELLTGKVEIEHLSENTWGSLLPNNAYLKVKQIVDWLVAVILLAPALIVLAVVAPLIRLSSPGPVFYAQTRIGYRANPFTVYKLRTMRVASAEENERAFDRTAAVTRDNDDRVTPIGRFLRRYRIDELPQILNILMGQMSWIGPRPEAVALSEWYESELPFYRYRLVVRPGITGWAQVHQGHVASPSEVLEKLNYDFFYIKYLSPWLDLLIVVRTVLTVLGGHGAK